MEKVTVSVYENEESYLNRNGVGCNFYVSKENVISKDGVAKFLHICKENGIFIEILINYTKGD